MRMFRHGIWMLVVGCASVVCWQAAQSATVNDDDAEMYRLFVDALEHVNRNYVKETDRRKLIESAINGMLDSLDPYSNYIGPNHFQQFNRHTTGKFGGIGIQIHQEADGTLKVISPLVGTPAYEAGILAGDRILKVNGEKIEGLRQDDIIGRLTGPAGTTVSVTVQHQPYSSTKPFDLTLTRAEIYIESVMGDTHRSDDKWNYIIDKDNGIGYVRLTSFTQNSKPELDEAMKQLVEEKVQGLVLDLRSNPGGLLSSAVEIADMFVESGVIVSTKGRNIREQKYEAKKEGTLPNFPMAVLVNQGSASASEIVAACLQDHNRAVVIGERTWGKGSVQNVIELEDGKSALKLTTASYARPNGKNIHRFKDSDEKDDWGVRPNDGFEVKMTNEEQGKYHIWRRDRDRIYGKPAKNKDAKPEDAKDAAKPAPPKPEIESFDDKQLAKALDYLRGEIKQQAAKKDQAAKSQG